MSFELSRVGIVEKTLVDELVSLGGQVEYLVGCLKTCLLDWERKEYERGLYEAKLRLEQKRKHYEFCKSEKLF